MRPNWFLAFPLDGSFVATLPPPPPSFRLFHAADLHLTLSFLGGCGEVAALAALAALDAELERSPARAVDVSLSDVVPMGPPREYSALSALLDRGRAETEACIARLRDVTADAASVPRERRTPTAHVTVARPSRRSDHAARQAGLVWASGVDLSAVSARLDRIALYTWAEGDRRQRQFRVVAERELKSRADLVR